MIPTTHTHISQVTNIWLAWSVDPSLLVIFLFSYSYFRGLKKHRKKKKHAYPSWRVLFFILAVLTLTVALISPLDYLSSFYFSAHMVQHILIVMVAAPFFILALPLLPIISGAQTHFPKLVSKLVRFKTYRWLLNVVSKPLITVIIYLFTFWVWHLPYFYNLALDYESIHYIQHFSYLATALLLWYSLLEFKAKRSFHLLRIFWILLINITNSVFSALIVFNSTSYYNYSEIKELLAIDVITDQKIGGLIMWILGNMMFIIAAAIIFLLFFKSEQKTNE